MPESGNISYHHSNSAGFTLIELLIVVAIIGIIASIAIPSLLRSRMSANESSAIAGLKTIATGQTDYFNNASPHTYSMHLENLGNGQGAGGVGFIAWDLAVGSKSGYTFFMTPAAPVGNNQVFSWSATAWPLVYRSSGIRSFYIDETGIIRGSDIGGIEADSTMTPLD